MERPSGSDLIGKEVRQGYADLACFRLTMAPKYPLAGESEEAFATRLADNREARIDADGIIPAA